MVKKSTPEEILAILDSGHFDELQGLVEDALFECKGALYPLEKEYGKRELAKDVVAFANAEGGLLLIGVKTEKREFFLEERVSKIRPLDYGSIDLKQYSDVIRDWVYPAPRGVDVRWFSSPTDRKKGILAILIPIQSPNQKPFLVTKTIEENGKQIGVLFGYFERSMDRVIRLPVQELQARLRDGERFGSISARLEKIEETLSSNKIPINDEIQSFCNLHEGNLDSILEGRVGIALSELGRNQEAPTYVLTAHSFVKVNFPTLFRSRKEHIIHLLEDPPCLRRNGFGLKAGDFSQNVHGSFRRVFVPEYKILILWKDGTLVFAGPADQEFLCWGRYGLSGTVLRVNPLALLESVFLFIELTKKVFNEAMHRPSRVEYRLGLKNMGVGEQKFSMAPGPLGSFDWEFGRNLKYAKESEKIFSASANWEEIETKQGKVAFRLVAQVYEWFGFDHESIPYCEEVCRELVVSKEKIIEAGRR